jgi:hypothetical protein
MQSIGFIAPLLPGKTETDRAAMVSSWRGERRQAHQASRSRLGISREAMYIQSTPAEMSRSFTGRPRTSRRYSKLLPRPTTPYDRWFRDHVREVHSINVEDGFPPPEQVTDLRVDRISRLDSEAV